MRDRFPLRFGVRVRLRDLQIVGVRFFRGFCELPLGLAQLSVQALLFREERRFFLLQVCRRLLQRIFDGFDESRRRELENSQGQRHTTMTNCAPRM